MREYSSCIGICDVYLSHPEPYLPSVQHLGVMDTVTFADAHLPNTDARLSAGTCQTPGNHEDSYAAWSSRNLHHQVSKSETLTIFSE